jgi:hypothetical protein
MLEYFEDELFEMESGEENTVDKVYIAGAALTIPKNAEGKDDGTDDTAE